MTKHKYCDKLHLKTIAERETGKRILYTGGTFDLFHFGHVSFLKKCKRIADKVVVGLNTDDFIERFKGSKPILTYKERYQSLNECKYIDEILKNECGEDSKPVILSTQPTIIAVGDDWAHKDYFKQMSFTQMWLDDNQITLVYIPYTKGISASEIKKRVIENKKIT